MKENIASLSKRERLQTILFYQIIVLFVLCLILGGICGVLSLQYKHIRIEAGNQLSASSIANYEGAVFGEDFDPDCVNHAGTYYFTVHSLDKDIEVKLHVEDTKAPVVQVKDIKIAVGGPFPEPTDFIDEIYEPDYYEGEYLSEIKEFKSLGSYDVKVRFTDASGNKTKVFDVKMQLIYDSVAPKITVNREFVTYVGEAISYADCVTLSDNCAGQITLEVDDSEINLNEAGEYKAYLTAIDAVGNKSEALEVTVKVYSEELAEQELFSRIDDITDRIINGNMSTEEKCRAVYDYVQKNISYTASSDKSSWQRAAYDALFVSGEGDCFSYFAAAKAFFEHLEIENLDIERTKGFTPDTHFWSLVNIGDGESERWYHFDATRLRAEYNHSGCLLTDKQAEAYNKVRQHFYLYDTTKYPEVATEIITPTPELEKYY